MDREEEMLAGILHEAAGDACAAADDACTAAEDACVEADGKIMMHVYTGLGSTIFHFLSKRPASAVLRSSPQTWWTSSPCVYINIWQGEVQRSG
jgi:hypothetical protein